MESGNDVPRQDDDFTTKRVNTVTEILSVLGQTVLSEDDARSEMQSSASSLVSLDIISKDLQELARSSVTVAATANNDNAREQNVVVASSEDVQENYYFGPSDTPLTTTTTSTAECAREDGDIPFVLTAKNTVRDKKKVDTDVPVATRSDSTGDTRGGKYFISTSTVSGGDMREQNGTENDRHSATQFRFEELGQLKRKDRPLNSPVETIPEEKESDLSRPSSRAGSQYFDSRQGTSGDVLPALLSHLHQLKTSDMRDKTLDSEGESQALTLTNTKGQMPVERSRNGINSTNAGSPNRTPLTSVSDSSSQSGEVFETYFGAEEITLSPGKKWKSPRTEVFETYFGRAIQSSKSEPFLSSERMEENDDKVLQRTASSDIQSTAMRPRTAGFSQRRKGKRSEDEISEMMLNKQSNSCINNTDENADETVKASTNQPNNENTSTKRLSTFYRSLSFSGESPVDLDAKQIDQSEHETPSELVSYVNGDNSNQGTESKLLDVLPPPSTPSETVQKVDLEVSSTRKPESKTFNSTVLTDSNSSKSSSLTNRRKTLHKMRSKWGTSYDIEVEKQRRLDTEVNEVDIKRITTYGDDNFPVSGTVKNEKVKNTGIESVPLRPPRHKKALKYSQSFATSRSTGKCLKYSSG